MSPSLRRLGVLVLTITACADDPMAPVPVPAVTILGVAADVPGVTCAPNAPCTVPDFARLAIQFTLDVPGARIEGYDWRIRRPSSTVQMGELVADHDTLVDVGNGTLAALRGAVATVQFEAAEFDSADGLLTFDARIRARDATGGTILAESEILSFDVVHPGPPRVVFVDVQNDRHDLQPCLGDEPCTVSWSAKLAVRWTAAADFARIDGFQWQLRRPHRPPEPTQPFGVDSLFWAAAQETTVVDAMGNPVWALHQDTLTVHFKAARYDTFSNVGALVFAARVRDSLGRLSDPPPGERTIQLVNPPLPTLEFLDVRAAGIPPCRDAAPCTIPAFTDYSVRFRGSSAYNYVEGYTWRSNFSPVWQPFGTPSDTLIFPVGRDTAAVSSTGDTLWSLAGDIVTAFVHHRDETPIPIGRNSFQALVRDDAGLYSRYARIIEVNFVPETRLYTTPACTCPAPPPGCAVDRPSPLGWVVGIGAVTTFPIEDWIPFCDGDTIPNSSHVQFYADGWDDPRDRPKNPATGLEEVTMRWRYEFERRGLARTNIPFSDPALPLADLPLQQGGIFRGARIGWETCPLDYVVQAAAVDEHGSPDWGTPASMRFIVGGAPSLDSVFVPPVMVFVPTCSPQQASRCPSFAPFGPDTLLVVGTHVPDATDPGSWTTPLGIGWNDFVFPFRGWGHDHPRDRNPEQGPAYYDESNVGRIRSWRYSFDCDTEPCADVSLHDENFWVREPPGDPPQAQAFDPRLTIRIPLDTLCVSSPCDGNVRARVGSVPGAFGAYRFTLTARDTDPSHQLCRIPFDLGPSSVYFDLDIARLGTETTPATRAVTWLPLHAVRPVDGISGMHRRRAAQ